MLYILLSIVLLITLFIYKFGAKYIENVPILPGSYPFLGHALLVRKVEMAGEMVNFWLKNCMKYNFGVYQVAFPGATVLVTSDAEHVKQMYSKEYFADFIKGKVFREMFKETLGHGIFAVDGEDWRIKRKVSSHMFSARKLRDHMTKTFRAHASSVMNHLMNSYDKQQNVDIQELFQCYTFDSIATIAFGVNVESLNGNERDLQFQRAYDFAQGVNSGRFMHPLYKIDQLLNRGVEGRLKKEVKIINDYVYQIVDERLDYLNKNETDNKGDMLSLYIEHGMKTNTKYNREYLRDMVINMLIAGRDTTAAASMWLFYELSKNPHVEERMLEEIDVILGDNEPTYDLLCKMTYSRAVFYETLRLHPSVPVEGKFAKRDIILQPGNIFLKKGDLIQFPIIAINRNPKYYDNANKFIPERWIDAENGKFKRVNECTYPTFNVAPRGCLGKRMAEFEAILLISTILPQYKLRVVDGFIPKSTSGVILFNENGMQMTVEKRHPH